MRMVDGVLKTTVGRMGYACDLMEEKWKLWDGDENLRGRGCGGELIRKQRPCRTLIS